MNIVPLPWFVKRRSIERDYRFYDPPGIVWKKINHDTWPYATKKIFYYLRDKALMCLLYLSCSKISEIVRADVRAGSLPSVNKSQFVNVENFLMLRNLPIVKHNYDQKGGRWVKVVVPEDYPRREEIDLPLTGGLSVFTEPVFRYLEYLEEEEELFKFHTKRAHQICRRCTGEFPHYFRDMGLKLRLRLFDKHLVQLKQFSGHKRIENLVRYLEEAQREDSRKRMLEYEEI